MMSAVVAIASPEWQRAQPRDLNDVFARSPSARPEIRRRFCPHAVTFQPFPQFVGREHGGMSDGAPTAVAGNAVALNRAVDRG
jgi:hypothetical protein